MARTHRRKAVLASLALVAATALLTACQQDTSDPSGAAATPDNATSSSAADPTPSAPADATASGDAGTPTQGDSAKATDEGSGTSGENAVEGDSKGKGVSGIWFGNVNYLAPGKYTVSDQKGIEQAFWLAEDTDIEGTGDICGDENGQAASPCTEAELEAAAKSGVSAEVTIKDGVAVRIVDDK